MCGIAGFWGFEDKGLLKQMCDSIRHRGPDEHGYHTDKDVCLGNRRLSIIDLKGGSQPIYNEDKSIVVVYNGEIYNFKDVREDLEKKGHRFSTNTDTEVLVHGYEEYGYDILSKLNGMFAFVIWDSRKKELFIARDRLGIKPLYYYWNGEVLLFASEIKAILRSKRINPEVSQRALYRFLTMRYIPGDITMIEGVMKLMPGYFLSLKNKNLEVKRYWDVSFGNEDKSLESCKKSIAELLEDSVNKRLISDVPLGAFLSGGIDSSIIVGLMSKFSDKVKTFSVGFEESGYSELDYARRAADYLGTNHQDIIIDSDKFIKAIPKMVYHLDEPIADSAAIPTYYLSELARKKVKVVLTGEGGDELFGGYPKYGMQKREYLTRYYMKAPRAVRVALKKASPGKYKLYADSLESAERFYLSPFMKNAKLLERGSGMDISGDIKGVFKPYLGNPDVMKEMQYVDIKTWLPEELLMKVDKMSMANSLEARVPFLDHRIVNLSMTIPSRFKIMKGVEKHVLRESFCDLLPRSTVERKKHPFSVPIKEWQRFFVDRYYHELTRHDSLLGVLRNKNLDSLISSSRYQDKFNLVIFHLWTESILRN